MPSYSFDRKNLDLKYPRRLRPSEENLAEYTGGTARWLYRVMRQHAGRQTGGWALSLKTLHAKSGSSQRLSDFARDLRRIAAANDLPEYHLTIYDGARADPCLHAVRRTLLAPGHQAHDPELLQDLGKRRTRPRA